MSQELIDLSKGQIIIYTGDSGIKNIEVIQQDNTLWLSAEKIAKLFDRDRTNIQRHIKHIFEEEELGKESTCAFFAQVQKEGSRTVTRHIPYYSLDVILAVGYRVSSQIATQFRKWATSILHKYLLDGYVVNKELLQVQKNKVIQLQNALILLNRSIENQAATLDEAKKLSTLMADFAVGLNLLDDYDNKTLDTKGKTQRDAVVISRDEFLNVIDKMKPEFGSDVFANPKDEGFDSSINQIYQTFGGKDCYPGVEEKAAMLLYFLVKNHSFTDGNKRIGAACFLYFLNKNGILYQNGTQIIDNAALFALTVLIAVSRPEEKETMNQVIISILNKGYRQ